MSRRDDWQTRIKAVEREYVAVRIEGHATYRRILALVVLVPALGFAPAPLPRPIRARPEADAKRLQGEWDLVEGWSRGKKWEEMVPGSQRLVITTDGWSLVGGGLRQEWTARLNPAATPRAVDLWLVGGDRRQAVWGIYRIDAGKLYFAYEYSSRRRPTSFDTNDGGYLLVFRRR
jgi:uncharacterized protein (TIGR03067 family)